MKGTAIPNNYWHIKDSVEDRFVHLIFPGLTKLKNTNFMNPDKKMYEL